MHAVRPRRLALVGLMGAGKSVLGREAAQRLGWPFLDADRLLEERAGMSVPEIFAGDGEAGFRARESALLEELAAAPAPFVLATGGGVVTSASNRERLAGRFWTAWLRVDPALAARRLAGDRTRPLLPPGDPEPTLAALAAERAAHYGEVARVTLDASLSLADLADLLLARLASDPDATL